MSTGWWLVAANEHLHFDFALCFEVVIAHSFRNHHSFALGFSLLVFPNLSTNKVCVIRSADVSAAERTRRH